MLIPDNINNFKSLGERIIFLKFKESKHLKEMYVLHSVFTNHHIKNQSGELDFLIIIPNHGIFALEIKHGRVRRQEGRWIYTNKDNEDTIKYESPFSQVNSTMNSIRNLIMEKFEKYKNKKDIFKKILFGTGILFTSMEEPIDFGQESHPWQIFYKKDLSLDIYLYLEKLSRGWHNVSKNKNWYNENNSRPDKKICEEIIHFIRGDFEIDYKPINQINDSESLIEQYTNEQFKLLDFVNYNERCIIQGPAGTGKTLMAIELARRNILNSKKVAIFSFNTLIGKKIHSTLSGYFSQDNYKDKFYAGSLHSFLLSNTNLTIPSDDTQVSNFFNETLPFEYLIKNEALSDNEKFDFLIVDESQDLLNPIYSEIFNLLLIKTLKKGRWVFFGDFNNQSIYNDNVLKYLEEFKNNYNITLFPPLLINCRNTINIVKQNSYMSGVPLPEANTNIFGDPINVSFIEESSLTVKLEKVIDELNNSGIPLNKVVLLSPRKSIKEILIKSEKINRFLLNKEINFQTIQAFKGMESAVIILFGFQDITSEDSQRLLYIGISRAKLRLYLILNKKLESDYSKLIISNVGKTE
jgi:hypothetical protein